MATRRNVGTDAPWAAVVGYSRAVRVGPYVHVSGTAPVGEGGRIVAAGDPYEQALHALRIIEGALREAGASLGDVVRTRIYVADIDLWAAIGRAHGEFFAEVRPATTMVEASRFIDPAILVEIEAEAIVEDDR